MIYRNIQLRKLVLIVIIFALVGSGLALMYFSSNDSNLKQTKAENTVSADINKDNIVDIIDLSILLSNWGESTFNSDLNADSKVDIVDLSILLSNWGEVSDSQYGFAWRPTKPTIPTGGVVKPESYGAKGDGITDDSNAIQNAIDYASANNKKVELAPDTTYSLDSRILLNDNSYIYGQRSTSILKFTWAWNDSTHDGLYIGNKGAFGDQTGDANITIKDFKVIGGSDGYPVGLNADLEFPTVPAIRLRLVDRFEITGVEVTSSSGMSILNQGCSNGIIHNNYVHNSGRDGIHTGKGDRTPYNIIVEDNIIQKVGDDALAVIGQTDSPNQLPRPYNIALINNSVEGWQTDINGKTLGRGIAIIAADKIFAKGNTINGTDSRGILIAGAAKANNTDPDTGEQWRVSNVSIIDTTIENARGEGIEISRGDYIVLTNANVISSNGPAYKVNDCNFCEY